MASGLPTPPTDSDSKLSLNARRPSKGGKPSNNRSSKRTSVSLSHEHGGLIIDGRHKRVWKACERCRMKKTKCDGESPCKRCKDDGLVCTAGSRKKTEFKQLPRGYAEVLENTQYALIATVQKLYTMVRNGESWDLGEPDINDRGLPVIHNIAEKLGCIRPSPDLPYAFPEDADEFAELQAQMKMESSDDPERTSSTDSTLLAHAIRMDRASSTDSDHSTLSKDYCQMPWAQQQQHDLQMRNLQISTQIQESQFDDEPLYQTEFTQEPTMMVKGAAAAAFNLRRATSPVYSDFKNNSPAMPSPAYSNNSPFSPWSAGDDFLGPSHMLDLTALYMRQQQQQQQLLVYQGASTSSSGGIPRSIPSSGLSRTGIANMSSGAGDYISVSDGTIRPGMLDCDSGYDLAGQMDNIMFGDYETQGLSIN